MRKRPKNQNTGPDYKIRQILDQIAGGIAPLISLLRDGTNEGKGSAAWALGGLACRGGATTRGLIADAYDWEVGGVQDGSEVVRDLANLILGNTP